MPSNNPGPQASTRPEKIALIFELYAKNYTGGIDLEPQLLNQISRDLSRAKVTLEELTQLDERPYALLNTQLASQTHWFMRRFRNSGGWPRVESLGLKPVKPPGPIKVKL